MSLRTILITVSTALVLTLLFLTFRTHPQAPTPVTTNGPTVGSMIGAAPIDIDLEKLAPPTYPTSPELTTALQTYAAGNFGEAVLLLTDITLRHPDDPTALLYLGISQLTVGRDDQALGTLNRANRSLAQPRDQPSIAWYRAIAAVRTHQPDAAPQLQLICKDPTSPYAPKACAAANQLAP